MRRICKESVYDGETLPASLTDRAPAGTINQYTCCIFGRGGRNIGDFFPRRQSTGRPAFQEEPCCVRFFLTKRSAVRLYTESGWTFDSDGLFFISLGGCLRLRPGGEAFLCGKLFPVIRVRQAAFLGILQVLECISPPAGRNTTCTMCTKTFGQFRKHTCL